MPPFWKAPAPQRRKQDQLLTWLLVLGGTLMVGVVDYVTGTEVRVFPLYLFPLALAARRFGFHQAIGVAVIAALVWTTAMYLDGAHYSTNWVWVINFLFQGSAFVLFAVLIAIQQRHLHREYQLSRTDPLTGLTNSRAFLEQGTSLLQECQRCGEPATLAFIDLDHFKQVNDRDGHDAGDRLLEVIGDLLRKQLSAHGAVARIGGDEFVVLLAAVDIDEARSLLASVAAAMKADPVIRASGVSASIGAVTLHTAPASLALMMKRADQVMYQVKSEGRDAIRVISFGDSGTTG